MVGSKKGEVFKLSYGIPLPLGVTKDKNKTYFSVVIEDEEECYLNLYVKGEPKKYASFLLGPEYRAGSIYAVCIENLPTEELEYTYEVKGREFVDPQAKRITGRSEWGKRLSSKEKKMVRGELADASFRWEEDKPLRIPYSELILYRMHVRGFTKHMSSRVRHKGTFQGVIEKVEYLKELGINAIEFLPVYEFNEIIESNTVPQGYQGYTEFLRQQNLEQEPVHKLNYWGYSKEAFYYAPKSAYAAGENASLEFKKLVKACHEAGIEVILEFYFTEGISPMFVVECFRHWVKEYHVDGFRFNGEVVSPTLLGTDPYLSKVKLICAHWDTYEVYRDKTPMYKNLAEYNEGFQTDIRRFLKGDEEHTSRFAARFKENPHKCAKINYITNTNGFTLSDLYSYDVKHNERNGEENRDGTDYNFSWNCGKEGVTKRKKVVELRRRQIRNALITLLFSQGTPLLLAGDEFGNSQMGNNNAYCQDNEISWLNWNNLKSNRDVFDFVKFLIAERKAHPILHMQEEFRVMDSISCGYPDLSYHGTKAWYPEYSNYSRVLGLLLCGKYARLQDKGEDCYFYFAYNMHWEHHSFDLPDLPYDLEWVVYLDSSEEYQQAVQSKELTQKVSKQLAKKSIMVKPRSIIILASQSRQKKTLQIQGEGHTNEL